MTEEMDKDWEEQLMTYARELPIEKPPSAMLEERTVRELRRRGLLRSKRSLPTAWLVGSVAASLALFATGVVAGQFLATRSTARALADLQQKNDAAAAAAHVQQTGSAYVQALEALVSAQQQNPTLTQDTRQAREVALTALHAAANEVVRLAPNDPVVAKILQGIEQEKRQTQQRPGTSQPKRQIVWF